MKTPMRVLASQEAVRFISDRGGLLFVWGICSHGPRCTLTLLRASVDPPAKALEYRRVELSEFLLFLHPDLRSLPDELWVELHGKRGPRVRVYWNGVAYVA